MTNMEELYEGKLMQGRLKYIHIYRSVTKKFNSGLPQQKQNKLEK